MLDRSRVLLLRNYREEWELPGGRPDDGESLADAATREVREETGLDVTAGAFVDFWDYEIEVEDLVVRVISFVATLNQPDAIDQLADLVMPEGYKRSIRLAERLSA